MMMMGANARVRKRERGGRRKTRNDSYQLLRSNVRLVVEELLLFAVLRQTSRDAVADEAVRGRVRVLHPPH